MRNRRFNAKKRKMQKSFRSWMIEIVMALLIAIFVVFYCMQFQFVHGHTMRPNYNDGDLVAVNKVLYRIREPRRMDVVMFRVNSGERGRYVIGRIVGLPGEKVQIKDGKFYCNQKVLTLNSEKLIKTPGEAQNEIKLADDEYFVLCDNYNSGEDSRMVSIGNVKRDTIIGKVMGSLIRKK